MAWKAVRQAPSAAIMWSGWTDPDLGAADHAVGLRHLGAEHHDGDGEGDLPRRRPLVQRQVVLRRRLGLLQAAVGGMPGDGAQQRTQRAAQSEPGHSADDFAPDAHVVIVASPAAPTIAAGRSRQGWNDPRQAL